MSADNGIYILETLGPEYRVRELQAVENVDWDESRGTNTDNELIIISNARRMWQGCEVFTDRAEAMAAADKALQETYICEYGISFIKVNQQF